MFCLGSLRISAGVSYVAGSGGKTTLLRTVGEELAAAGARVVLATTTHFLPFAGLPLIADGNEDALAAVLASRHIACVGAPLHKTGRPAISPAARSDLLAGAEPVPRPSATPADPVAADPAAPAPEGPVAADPAAPAKLGPSPISLARLAELADYVIVEADGSKRLPLKAHAHWEPALDGPAGQTILVVGASGFGRPVSEAAHRPELFCERAGCAPADAATPARVAQVIEAEVAAGMYAPDTVVLNQYAGTGLPLGIGVPLLAGNIREHRLEPQRLP